MKLETKKTYKATFILDTRGQERSVEHLIEDLTKEINALDGEVESVNNRGEKEFARVTDPKFVAGVYVEFVFSAPPLKPNALLDRVRLNTVVNRVLVQAV